ncbi:MAG: DEAD/DEAH box helicase [Promethearchaeota archaeon]
MIKATQRMTGTVKWYNEKKGFGFITLDRNGKDIFLHHTAMQPNQDNNITSGDCLTFAIQSQKKGFAAVEVKRLNSEEVVQSSISEEIKPIQYNQIDSGLNFADLDLDSEILQAVRDSGYKVPTPIQAHAIPLILKGKDVLGCAQTGTGKTAAYALPILQRLVNTKNNNNVRNKRKIRVLVVAPTRELAIQIKDSFSIYGKYTGLRNTIVYGGVGQNPQVKKLQQGVDILVATPGRLLDLMRQGHINLGYVEVLILDEGDRMLDMGFINDIRSIIKSMPIKNRQTLLFSATIPQEVKKLANSILNKPIRIDITPDQPTLEILKQTVFIISKKKKQALLEKLLTDKSIKRALVFMRTKHSANRVVKTLKRKGMRTDAIHGDKSQKARQDALQKFRTGNIRVLVATDVASRGIDVDGISHVIQFDLPNETETYLHRIGRTARAGAGGIAYAFCEEDELHKLKEIEKLIRMRLKIVKNHI